MVVRYEGASTVNVRIESRGVTLYSGTVNPNDNIVLDGSTVNVDRQSTLGTNVNFYVNGTLVGSMHTSCSVPIGPGTQAGDFVLVWGTSRIGGLMCAVEN